MYSKKDKETLVAAKRLRLAREEKGFRTAAAFARTVGVSEVTYRSHENGTRRFGSRLALKYSEILDVDFSWLLFGVNKLSYSHSMPPSCAENDSYVSDISQQNFIAISSGKLSSDDYIVQMPEIDAQQVVDESVLLSQSNRDYFKPLNYWGFSQKYLLYELSLNVDPCALFIMRVNGRDMEPLLMLGDRVMVNMQSCFPFPPGLFVLQEYGRLSIKYLEIIPGGDHFVALKTGQEEKGKKCEWFRSPLKSLNIIGQLV